ncbi:MAG: carboxypeptidase-like regulatory domain-containing protein [Ekhidna sp.]|nr:carboxypeptidase-like regulatory domain-containing protein [Ekhidna sp.]
MAQFVIEGYVINRDTTPIPFTSVYNEASKNISYANINGYFKLELDALPITLTFSSIGYHTKEILISESGLITVVLEERILELNEVIVQSRKLEHKYIGSPKKRRGVTSLHVYDPFDQWGIIVINKNNELYNNPKLLSFSIKIGSWSFISKIDGVKPNGEKQLRLRIYSLNANHLVGEDILHENIYLSPSDKGWYKVDIENIAINIPKRGFVLAVEWIENNPTYTYQVKHKFGKQTTETQYGLSIHAHRMSSRELEFYTSVKLINMFNNEWEKDQVFPNYIPCFQLEYIEPN